MRQQAGICWAEQALRMEPLKRLPQLFFAPNIGNRKASVEYPRPGLSISRVSTLH